MKKIILILIIIAFVLLGGFYFTYQYKINSGNGANVEEIVFSVESGEGVKTIADKLLERNLINSRAYFLLYVRNQKLEANFQAGDYVLNKAMPLKKIRGRKTEQVVRTELNIGAKTSPTPLTTASLRGTLRSRICVILSITIIELSTIIPIPRINPERDIIFIEIPATKKKSSETIRERGIVVVTSIGERKSCRKKKITKQARIAPRIILFLKLDIE